MATEGVQPTATGEASNTENSTAIILKNEIDRVLLSLRMAKELENKRTVQKINTHKSVIKHLYESLEAELEEFKRHIETVNEYLFVLLANILSSLDQLRQADKKLQNEICNISKRIEKLGFGAATVNVAEKSLLEVAKVNFHEGTLLELYGQLGSAVTELSKLSVDDFDKSDAPIAAALKYIIDMAEELRQFDYEIDSTILDSLKTLLESIYKDVEEDLWKKNDAVIRLYQQLSVEKAELAKKHTPNDRDSDTLLPNVLKTLDEIEGVVVDLENAIDDVLKRSHVLQRSALEQNLYDHKAKFIALYQELNDERYQLENDNQTVTDGDDLTSFWSRIGRTIKEVERLREMRQIGQGFGRTKQAILERDFDVTID